MDLTDVRVLDLTRLLPGPYATQLLADAGADVIKIEEPSTGDYARAMAAGGGPDIFSAVNRGKRSVALDLTDDEATEVFYDLAADADVVIEGFRPGVVDRLAVDYESVRERNPGIVYCSLSGFGATGPYRDRVGHDLNYIGLGGLLDLTRAERDGSPAIPGVPVADLVGAVFAAFAVLAGLQSRALGDGTGEHIDLSMTDLVLALVGTAIPATVRGEERSARSTPLTGLYPCYDVYEAADGKYVTLAALEPEFWRTFCEAVGRPDLVDEQFHPDPQDREAVRQEVAEVFRERSRDEWEDRLADQEAMVAPVYSPAEAFATDHVEARDLVIDAGPHPRIGVPFHTSGSRTDHDETVPKLGEHTREVLLEHDIDEAAIDRLR